MQELMADSGHVHGMLDDRQVVLCMVQEHEQEQEGGIKGETKETQKNNFK
jgi:hypothetical protein